MHRASPTTLPCRLSAASPMDREAFCSTAAARPGVSGQREAGTVRGGPSDVAPCSRAAPSVLQPTTYSCQEQATMPLVIQCTDRRFPSAQEMRSLTPQIQCGRAGLV